MKSEQPLIEAAASALEKVPGVRLARLHSMAGHQDQGIDAQALLEVEGRQSQIFIQVKHHGSYPRDVREAARQLKAFRETLEPDTPVALMYVAPTISQTSREYLRQEGIGYADSTGSLFLHQPGAFVLIDREMPRGMQPERKRRNIFKGSSAQVLHVLLADPNKAWGIAELAEAAEVAPSTVHETFVYLEQEAWVERRGQRPHVLRTLQAPGALLDAWAAEHSLKQYRILRYYRWVRTSEVLRKEVTALLASEGLLYALTLNSGAELVAPHVTGNEQLSILLGDESRLARIALEARLSHAFPKAGFEPVDEGANVTFFIAPGRASLMLRREIQGSWVASDIQLYLDLMASPLRGKEQAAFLRRERIGF